MDNDKQEQQKSKEENTQRLKTWGDIRRDILEKIKKDDTLII